MTSNALQKVEAIFLHKKWGFIFYKNGEVI